MRRYVSNCSLWVIVFGIVCGGVGSLHSLTITNNGSLDSLIITQSFLEGF